MLLKLISRQRFPHVKGVFAVGVALDVVAVVANDTAEDRVTRG
jgi:hypothetical protein